MRKLALSDEILMRVEKPARYIGNEINSVKKDLNDIKVRFAMCFPDVYDIGMSHLGIQILYDMFNKRDDVYCERVYSPWTDLDEIMRKENIPLFALESQEPVKNFDFLGITLQYEMCYTNVLQVLDLSQIPIFAKDRTEEHPIVIGGGPCVYNPEPIADFFDMFYIGEGETQYGKLIDLYKECKNNGLGRQAFLRRAAEEVPGIYVPSMYEVEYNEDGTIKSFEPIADTIPRTVKKEIEWNLSDTYYPEKPLVPFIKAVQDRVVLEIQRGCIRGCRFCQAGMVYRPYRARSYDKLCCQARETFDNSGYEEISLLSLSISDYDKLSELVDGLKTWTDKKKVGLSLPSMRIDAFESEIMEKVNGVRKTGLTFAPEAGTQRLRDVINKNLTEEEILEGCRGAFSKGRTSVKLYFMLGLPTETDEDICGIPALGQKIIDEYYKNPDKPKGKSVEATMSVSCFVPKSHTPFQWEAQDTLDELVRKQKLLGTHITTRKLRYNWHEAKVSRLEAIFARGDRRLSAALAEANRQGFMFDGWDEYFSYDKWMAVFEKTGIDPSYYANRRFEFDEILPWSHISCGVSEDFLLAEAKKARMEQTTPDCRSKCSACGMQKVCKIHR